MTETTNKGRFKNPVEAVLVGTKELIRVKPNTRPINDSDRLDGKTCLITGANSGVGWGVAKLWAERGATLIMACRTLVPDRAAELRELSGNPNIKLYDLDLGDFNKIDAFVEALKADGIRLDVSLFNAGLGAAKAKKTALGFEELFQVNYLAKFYLVNRLLAEGVIPNKSVAGNREEGDPVHRMMFTSSDSHRGAQPVNTDTLGVFYEYGAKGRDRQLLLLQARAQYICDGAVKTAQQGRRAGRCVGLANLPRAGEHEYSPQCAAAVADCSWSCFRGWISAPRQGCCAIPISRRRRRDRGQDRALYAYEDRETYG